MERGIDIKFGVGDTKLDIKCEHQNGVLYVVPSEANWVCSESLLHAHSIAGFFSDITNLDDESLQKIMQKWGIYYRTVTGENSGQGDSEDC